MDPFTLLKRDHKRVTSYFDELFSAPTVEKRKDIFNELKRELQEHMGLEENYFHPIMEYHNKTLKTLHYAQDDFSEVRKMLRELSRKKKYDKNWNALLVQLHEMVKHHFRDDRRMFSQVDELTNYHQQQDIGDRMLKKKEKRHRRFLDRLRDYFLR